MHHHHHHGTGKILKWSAVATLAFVVFEVGAGFRAGSLALLSDAGHNFTDALALIMAAFGYYLQFRPADDVKTYGYHRAGVLAAFVNALTLVILSLFLFWEAMERLLHPAPVQSTIMMVVSAIALLLNSGIMLGLHRDKNDLNVRAAFIHMLGDALSSVAIIAGAILIRWTGWLQVDPILSILIGVLIIWTAWDIIKESLNVLLEGLPSGLELRHVTDAMRGVEGVMDVHDLHIWSLSSSAHALSCHVLIDDMPPSSSEAILKRINTVLCRFHIHHSTVQFEHVKCALSQMPCTIPVQHGHDHDHEHSHE
ncbi:MAG: cation transporter [Acidobacteriaceae bacterium]|nr:cation transporter [Acidobacteriaceae bacterium]